ncbi:mandelate racemase/muconate lactonizing enzyme family protein [Ruania alba]|uniref:mandelate racemase/muconate lactonizing enzyme family protein n=1 Tax=Ruania alba TaxID=648782 RepID=UPI000B7EB327|nr:mandelate racemase/muconate lactonizing enzyme family protein [Ruania alba]
MKITDIRITHLEQKLDPPFDAAWDPVPRTSFGATLVFVDTDAGLTGVGSGDTMVGFAAHAHHFIGQDPLRMVRHVEAIESINFHAGRFWPLEVALWDLVGKVCGQPVSVLFGGAVDRLPVYASCGELKAPQDRAESALALREEGFRALKIRIDPRSASTGIAAVRAVRDAVGHDLDIMVDLNQAWRAPGDTTRSIDLPAARRIAEELRELDILWLEEPLKGDDHRGLADLRRSTGVRIAGGEMTQTFGDSLALLEADAYDVYQNDVVLAAGMHRSRQLAELAKARNRTFTPHTWSNGIGLLANLHVAAGVGAGPYLEYPYDPPNWTPERRDFMLAEPLRIDSDGCLPVPSTPGLGIALAPEVV